MSQMTGVTMIGAGVIGLAIASELSGKGYDILLLEKMKNMGRNRALAIAKLFMLASIMKRIPSKRGCAWKAIACSMNFVKKPEYPTLSAGK